MKRTILTTMSLLLVISMFYVGGEASAKVKVAAPSISVASKTKTSVKLSVKSSNKKMTGYKFYKWNGKKYVKVATKKVSAGKKKVSYTFKSLKKNTSYKFKITAYRTYKGKTYSASKTKSVKTLKGSSSNDSGSTNKDTPSVPDFGTDDDYVYTPPEAGWEQKMLDKVNEYRRKEGVPELVLNQDLCNIALIRCKAVYNMVINENKKFEEIAHLNSKEYFKEYYKGLGFDYYYLRYENAAGGRYATMDYTSWEEVLKGWVNSSGHYATMTTKTKDFTDFGVAYYGGFWYQTFEDRNYKIYFADEALWE